MTLWESGLFPASRLAVGAEEFGFSVEVACKKPEWAVSGTLILRAKAGPPVRWALLPATPTPRGGGRIAARPTFENGEDITDAFEWLVRLSPPSSICRVSRQAGH